MPLINCEINVILTWSANCVISKVAVNPGTTFAITDTKLYVPVATLSTEDNATFKIRIQTHNLLE